MDLLTFQMLWLTGLSPAAAHILSFLAATAANYALNSRWAFAARPCAHLLLRRSRCLPGSWCRSGAWLPTPPSSSAGGSGRRPSLSPSSSSRRDSRNYDSTEHKSHDGETPQAALLDLLGGNSTIRVYAGALPRANAAASKAWSFRRTIGENADTEIRPLA